MQFRCAQVLAAVLALLVVECSLSASGQNAKATKEMSTAKLETKNMVSRFFTRLLNDQQYFEIPNYPLDQQPDPEHVTHIDADLREFSGEIRRQKNCGACYAFSWLSYVEWHYCAQHEGRKKIDLSEQHLIDCGAAAMRSRLGGCESGYLPSAMDFSQLFGFELESEYPYRAQQGPCKRKMGSMRAQIRAKRLKFDRALWERVLEEQPILAQVSLPVNIQSYSRGIHPGDNCDLLRPHGMLLVGHGRQDGHNYWLLRNSMGADWGENGYLRLSREAPEKCMRTGFLARIKFKDSPDTYASFYDNLKLDFDSLDEIVNEEQLLKEVLGEKSQ